MMGVIEIPFLPEFEGDLRRGYKTATTRSKRYAKTGEEFKAVGERFYVRACFKLPLWVVALWFYRQEGFDCSQEFIECWNKIHPVKQYVSDPHRLVWLHLFRRVE